MIKIEIKTVLGSILFEHSKENNTIKDTLIKAVSKKAYLRGADLRGAYLRGADLRGADGEKITILKAAVFTGLYKYIAVSIITEDGKQYIRLGCYTRLVEDWDKDFWNNVSEFPNDGNLESQFRVMAYEFCKQWINLNLK